MRRRALLAGCGASVLAGAAAALPGWGGVARADVVHVDGLAAVVGARSPRPGAVLVRWSDVDLRAHLARLAATGTYVASPVSRPEREQARERLIADALLIREARRLRLDEVGPPRLAIGYRAFFDRHGGAAPVESLVASLSLARGELDQVVAWEVATGDFVRRSAAAFATVTDAEVDAAFVAENHPFVGLELEQARESLRAFLLERRLDDERARVVARLAARVPVARRRLP